MIPSESSASHARFGPASPLPAGTVPSRHADSCPDFVPVDEVSKARRPGSLRVLWIDDEVRPDDALLLLLGDEGIDVEVAGTGAEGLRRALATRYHAILVDLRLPDMYGFTVVQRLVASQVRAAVLVVTGYYLEPETEVDARRLGAAGVLHKPFLGAERLAAAIKATVDGEGVADRFVAPDPPFGIVAASSAMHEIVTWVESVARSKLNVLVTGETGTGKELIARAIHEASPRGDGPFVPVNCAAIPDSLFESELFGHRKGAFTGASENTTGLIEAAHGGTLFLDEVGEIPATIQARLLRCLEDSRVRRVGETRERITDVRVIAATNRSPHDEMTKGGFRSDLYFRLAGASTDIPPLRERRDDIAALIRYWLPRLARHSLKGAVAITPGAVRVLEGDPWPGNARQLHNVLEHALCLASGNVLTEREVAAALYTGASNRHPTLQASSKDRVRAELEANHWNRTQTARSLGIGRTTLWRWLRSGKPGTDAQ